MLNSIREAKGVSQEGHGREIEEDNLSSIGGQTSLSTRFSKSKLRKPKIKFSMQKTPNLQNQGEEMVVNEGEKALGGKSLYICYNCGSLVSLMLHVPNPEFALCALERITLQIGAPSGRMLIWQCSIWQVQTRV